jgi:hypothetical protein
MRRASVYASECAGDLEGVTITLSFELDGTLLHSLSQHYRLYREIVSSWGKVTLLYRQYWRSKRTGGPLKGRRWIFRVSFVLRPLTSDLQSRSMRDFSES